MASLSSDAEWLALSGCLVYVVVISVFQAAEKRKTYKASVSFTNCCVRNDFCQVVSVKKQSRGKVTEVCRPPNFTYLV